MELTLPYTSLVVFLLVIALKFLSQKLHRLRNLPPSPPSLPVIGHLHLHKQPFHRNFKKLSESLGPIFSLWLGSQLAVVISSPSAVEECFTKNDIVLANRNRLTPGKYFGYNFTTVSESPYGDHWRNLRRLISIEILSTTRLDAFLSVRQDEVMHLLRGLYHKSSTGFDQVEMKSRFSGLTFNIMIRMIAGKRYYGNDLENSTEAGEFRDLVSETFLYSSQSNPPDFLPVLRWIGYKGIEQNVARIQKRMDEKLQGLIDEHRREKTKNTMIDHLLSLQESQPEYYTDEIIKGLMSVSILAGTDTSSVTLEWALSLLLNHPEVLKKARTELDTHIGPDRLIDEHDLSELPYLQAIISETFRLFPPGPMLLPHMSSADCTIGGYNVPGDTLLLVNAWAIQRDPKVWDDPESFKPERFDGGKVEGYKLMPFGFGRRACPGTGLAQRLMGFALGSLIQCFEWERVGEEPIDYAERMGLTVSKLEPLQAMCKARDVVKKVL